MRIEKNWIIYFRNEDTNTFYHPKDLYNHYIFKHYGYRSENDAILDVQAKGCTREVFIIKSIQIFY